MPDLRERIADEIYEVMCLAEEFGGDINKAADDAADAVLAVLRNPTDKDLERVAIEHEGHERWGHTTDGLVRCECDQTFDDRDGWPVAALQMHAARADIHAYLGGQE